MDDSKTNFDEYNKLIERINKHNTDQKNYNLLIDKINIEIENVQRRYRALLKSNKFIK